MRGQDLGYGASTQPLQPRMSRSGTMTPDMLGQQVRGPQLLRIPQILWLLTGQIDDPGFVLVGDRPPAASPRQIAQGSSYTEFQSLGNAALHAGSIATLAPPPICSVLPHSATTSAHVARAPPIRFVIAPVVRASPYLRRSGSAGHAY